MPTTRPTPVPNQLENLGRKFNLSLDQLSANKTPDLTVVQQAALLKIEPRQLTPSVVLTPNKPRIGNSFLGFHYTLAVISRPGTSIPPDTGRAIFNCKYEADTFGQPLIEIGFEPINQSKPHLVEINIELLNYSATPPKYHFQTRMFLTSGWVDGEVAFSTSQPITLIFPVVTGKLADGYQLVQLRQIDNLGQDLLWAFKSAKITSIAG